MFTFSTTYKWRFFAIGVFVTSAIVGTYVILKIVQEKLCLGPRKTNA